MQNIIWLSCFSSLIPGKGSAVHFHQSFLFDKAKSAFHRHDFVIVKLQGDLANVRDRLQVEKKAGTVVSRFRLKYVRLNARRPEIMKFISQITFLKFHKRPKK